MRYLHTYVCLGCLRLIAFKKSLKVNLGFEKLTNFVWNIYIART